MSNISSSSQFDSARTYRYLLTRQWGEDEQNFINFILLNPSTADETKDDPTMRRCINFAKQWGYDGMYVTNLFAYRSTDPKKLKQVKDPIGPENDDYIKKYANRAQRVVVAWGNHGELYGRGKDVIEMLSGIEGVCCLGKTKKGEPRHPLYVANCHADIIENSL